jgi:MFS family permease
VERQLIQPEAASGNVVVFWKNPSSWLQEQNLSRGYWVFFTVAFFFDAGFSIYYFLFNLYLLDLHFNERAMGLLGGAAILGSLIGTLPAGMLARKFGLRPLLIICLATAPLLSALRAEWMWEFAQISLAFLGGLAMCIWGVCYLPAVARLTTEKNRTAAFSLIFSVSVGTSILGGIFCGYLPRWLRMAGFAMNPAEVKRLILLFSCAMAMLGLFPLLRLRLPSLPAEEAQTANNLSVGSWLSKWKLPPFLRRFLLSMALWSAVLAVFTPFANVYLSRDLHIPMARIGLIFSMVQVLQLCMGLLTPMVFRALGLVNGIVATQIVTAFALAALAEAHNGRLAVILYLALSAAQWMSSPGLYNLVMNETPDRERSTASAMTMFCNTLAGAAATTGGGILLTRFGYPSVLLGLSAVALAAAILFRLLIKPRQQIQPAQP